MTFLYIILGLTLIIFIHELGHFLAARWAGVKVLTFSIGIGPRLFTLYKDRQGTEYIICMIPLGGFVRMKGQEDLPTKKNYEKRVDNDHYLAKSTWKRMVIILAGVVMNFVLAYFLIIFAYNLGIPFMSNKVGNVIPNSPAFNSGVMVNDEIIRINNTPINSFEDIITEVALASTAEPLSLTVLRDQQEKTIAIKESKSNNDPSSAVPFRQIGISPYLIASVSNLPKDSFLYQQGVRNNDEIKKIILEKNNLSKTTLLGMNDLIANNPGEKISLIFEDRRGNIKTLNQIVINKDIQKGRGFYFTPQVKVIPGFPAERAGMMDKDVITAINGEAIISWEDIITALNNKKNVEENVVIPLVVNRQREEVELNVRPIFNSSSESYFIGISPLENNNSRKVSAISDEMEKIIPGIRVGDEIVNLKKENNLNAVVLIRDNNQISFTYSDETLATKEVGYLFDFKDKGKIISYDLSEAIVKAFPLMYQEFKTAIVFLKRLVNQDVPLEVLGGPIAIFETSYTVHEVKGWAYFILLFAKISISIAVLNLLPIPGLDGGHAVFTLYEMIRRKPLPENVLRTMYLFGFLLLIFLMVYVNYNDITRIINR